MNKERQAHAAGSHQAVPPPRPLDRLPAGSRGQVVAIHGGAGLAQRLAEMGLTVGSSIAVCDGTGGSGPVTVESAGGRLELGRGMTARIMVGPAPGTEGQFPSGPPTLAEAREGELVRVVRLGGSGAIRQRLMDMGVRRGVELVIERYAPLRDPMQIRVMGYSLALRVADAGNIEIEWRDHEAPLHGHGHRHHHRHGHGAAGVT